MFSRFRRRATPAPSPVPPAPDGAGLQVLETATANGFVAAQYLAANPDVARNPKSRADPRRHFERHGLSEGRLQIASSYLAHRDSRNRARFETFAPLLLTDPPFRHLRQDGAFPIQYGGGHHDLADYDGESANAGFGPFIEETRAHPDRRYLDVGCGLRNMVYDNCLYLEVYPSLTADLVVEPGRPYPIASGSMDGIGCFAVLEHVSDPWALARELRRILKPGGLLFVDWPFLQPVHGYPSHYFNATRYGLAHMFAEGFETLELTTHPNQSADHTMTWLLGEMVRGMADGAAKKALLGKTVAELVASAPGDPFWRGVTGAMTPTALTALACGNTLVARKT